MAYNNINGVSLLNSLNACKNTLNYSNSQQIKNSLQNNNVWLGNVRDNVIRSLNNLIDNDYDELERLLDQYINIANKIIEYQGLESQVNSLKQECQNLENKLYYEEDFWYENEEGKWLQDKRTVMDTKVKQQIDSKNTQIKNNKERMEALEQSINRAL